MVQPARRKDRAPPSPSGDCTWGASAAVAAVNSCAFRHNAEFGHPHTFSSHKVDLLAFDRYDSRLCIKESLAIQFYKPKLNLDQQSTKLLLL